MSNMPLNRKWTHILSEDNATGTMVELSMGALAATPSRVLRACRSLFTLMPEPLVRRSGRQRGASLATA